MQVAQQNVTAAGVADKVKIAVGPAADTLVKQHPDIPYDLAFIDADKPNNLTYFIEAKRLVRSGGVIVCNSSPIPEAQSDCSLYRSSTTLSAMA